MMNFELTILGSNSAIPTSERYPTAQVLNVSERFFLIDCGEGTQIQMRRLRFSFAKIRHVFISHLHGDHFYGLIGFISTRNLLGIKSDLHIFSHSELKDILQPQLNQLKGELGFNIIFHPLNFKKSEKIYSDKKAEVYSFPLKHSIPVCGFLFREKQKLPHMKKEKISQYQIPLKQIQAIKEGGDFVCENGELILHNELTTPAERQRSYAFCTDTIFHEPVIDIIKGVDLLYHEATFQKDMQAWATKTLHSTTVQAAEIALRANVKKLIIGHFSSRYSQLEPLLNEAKQIFEPTELAIEGAKFVVE